MLTMPINGSSVVTIIGIDPGSSRLGLSILRFSADWPHNIVSTESMTFCADRFYNKDSWVGNQFGPRISRVAYLEEELLSVFVRENPINVTYESPFMSFLQPSAYGALTEVLCAIRSAVLRYSPWTSISFVDPPTAKKAVGAPGNAKKDVMYQKVMELGPVLQYCGLRPFETLDEHSIDSLAIVYWRYITMMRELCLPGGN